MCQEQLDGAVFVQASERTAETVTHEIYRQGPIVTVHRVRTTETARGEQYINKVLQYLSEAFSSLHVISPSGGRVCWGSPSHSEGHQALGGGSGRGGDGCQGARLQAVHRPARINEGNVTISVALSKYDVWSDCE